MPEKYREEIEEILKQAEKLPSSEAPSSSSTSERQPKHTHLKLPKPRMALPRISAAKLMLAALALFLVAAVLWGTGGPVMPLVWVGLALFIGAYIMFFARTGTPRLEKRWRGRLVEEDEPSSDLWQRIKRWLRY